MPSLITQLQWCAETYRGLKQYELECLAVANNIDAMMRDLEVTFFEELYVPIAEVYPHFQISMQELFADVVTIESPYVKRQLDALHEISQKINTFS